MWLMTDGTWTCTVYLCTFLYRVMRQEWVDNEQLITKLHLQRFLTTLNCACILLKCFSLSLHKVLMNQPGSYNILLLNTGTCTKKMYMYPTLKEIAWRPTKERHHSTCLLTDCPHDWNCCGGDACCGVCRCTKQGEGDCDSNTECQFKLLHCGDNNCRGSNRFDSNDDCCYLIWRGNNKRDCRIGIEVSFRLDSKLLLATRVLAVYSVYVHALRTSNFSPLFTIYVPT